MMCTGALEAKHGCPQGWLLAVKMGKSEKEKQWLSPLVNQLVSPGDVVMELPDTSHQVKLHFLLGDR